MLYSVVAFLSSAAGYVYAALLYDPMGNKWFFMAISILMLGVTILYLSLEGYQGFIYPFKRKKAMAGVTSLKLLEGTEADRPDRKNKSLFEQSDTEIKKEQYINCSMFYGKYFTGDTFSTSTPFVNLAN